MSRVAVLREALEHDHGSVAFDEVDSALERLGSVVKTPRKAGVEDSSVVEAYGNAISDR